MYIIYHFLDHGSIGFLFVTPEEESAKSYVEKHNKLFYKWRKYYSKYENPKGDWIDTKHILKHFNRWMYLRNKGIVFYEKIEFRK